MYSTGTGGKFENYSQGKMCTCAIQTSNIQSIH